MRFDTIEVWTKAGRAELNVYIDSKFAHLYFRFDDKERAIQFDDCLNRLNRFSGKWNRIAAPGDYAKAQDSIDVFRANLRRDFRRVADPNPVPEEVASYRAKEAKRAAQWSLHMQTTKEES